MEFLPVLYLCRMNKQVAFEDLGFRDYKDVWDYQEQRFQEILEIKVQNRRKDREDSTPNYFLFVEHPHVYTLGKSGDEHNLLIRQDFLNKINATYFRTNRGGDITYHGPGQIVGYPILDLEHLGIGIKQYITLLEAAIIELLLVYGISSSRMEGATGVWLDADHPVKARKICAIGVRSSRHITMHGFALNVNTILDYFTYINPCGFETKGVTSMKKELGATQDFETIKNDLRMILMQGLGKENQ